MTAQFTPTEAQWGRIGNFAHRTTLFQEAIEAGDFSSAYQLAEEYNLSDDRVKAARKVLLETRDVSFNNVRDALLAAHEAI